MLAGASCTPFRSWTQYLPALNTCTSGPAGVVASIRNAAGYRIVVVLGRSALMPSDWTVAIDSAFTVCIDRRRLEPSLGGNRAGNQLARTIVWNDTGSGG